MRTVMELNKNWYFQKENVGLPQELPCDWAKVDLPHTWNAVDGPGRKRRILPRSMLVCKKL